MISADDFEKSDLAQRRSGRNSLSLADKTGPRGAASLRFEKDVGEILEHRLRLRDQKVVEKQSSSEMKACTVCSNLFASDSH